VYAIEAKSNENEALIDTGVFGIQKWVIAAQVAKQRFG
jgi:hypothetical protein